MIFIIQSVKFSDEQLSKIFFFLLDVRSIFNNGKTLFYIILEFLNVTQGLVHRQTSTPRLKITKCKRYFEAKIGWFIEYKRLILV